MREERVPFDGWDLVTFINEKDGDAFVAVRPIAEAIGVNWSKQQKKLTQDPKFRCVLKDTHDSSGRNQEMLCLPVKELNGWLYSINTNRVKNPEVRARLLNFQRDCHIAIYNHMSGKVNPKVIADLRSTIELITRQLEHFREQNSQLVEELKYCQE